MQFIYPNITKSSARTHSARRIPKYGVCLFLHGRVYICQLSIGCIILSMCVSLQALRLGELAACGGQPSVAQLTELVDGDVTFATQLDWLGGS